MKPLKYNLPIDKITERYLDGESITSIAKSYNVDFSVIKKRLEMKNVKFRNNSEAHRKYKYNRKIFNKIDTPLKAYFLGFILGDGSVYNKNNGHYKLSLQLHKKDVAVVKKFADLLEMDKEAIYIPSGDPDHRRVDAYSKELCEDLYKHGIPRKRKTYTAKYIETDYPSSFWLGVFDADGGFSLTKRPNSPAVSLNVELTGTKDICDGFSKYMGMGGKNVYRRDYTPTSHRFRKKYTKSKDLINLYNHLYGDVPFALPRKKEILINAIKNRKNLEKN